MTRTKPEPKTTDPTTNRPPATNIPTYLPVAASSVSAGFPSPADDFTQNSIDLNEHLIKHPAATFFVRVSGNSMTGEGIHTNDLLIIDRSLEPYNNAIIIAIVDGEFTVKRLRKKGTTLYLQPENNNFRPIRIDEHTNFEVWGVVTWILHPANL